MERRTTSKGSRSHVTEGSPHDRSGEKDQVKPFHAKDVASGQEAADAVAAVIKHAAERDEAARRKAPAKTQPKWMLPLGLNLGLLAVYLLIAPPSWVIVNPIAPPPDEQRVGNLRTLRPARLRSSDVGRSSR